jgi:hypothetical protein
VSPLRVLGVGVILLLGATLAVGMWGEAPQRQRSADDYISIAISQPEIFRAGAPLRTTVTPSNPVVVEIEFERERYRVYIDPRTDQVMRVERR